MSRKSQALHMMDLLAETRAAPSRISRAPSGREPQAAAPPKQAPPKQAPSTTVTSAQKPAKRAVAPGKVPAGPAPRPTAAGRPLTKSTPPAVSASADTLSPLAPLPGEASGAPPEGAAGAPTRDSRNREEIAFDPGSGISVQDQKEILSEIDKVATENRIAVTPELFALKAAKKGLLFPFLVNLIALLALVGGLAGFYFLFQKNETQAARESALGITAEGKLIEELKKESEAKLQEKNQQIGEIQDRLVEIDKERQDLVATMDARVSRREGELRETMAAELEAEKERLRKQGFSEQEIAKRIADMEARKNAEFARQLEAYRKEAEAEMRRAEADLVALRTEFNTRLTRANSEKQSVLADAERREEELRSQLEQKEEVEKAQAQAEQALRSLVSQKEKEDLVEGQLVGLYTVAKTDISSRSFAKALSSLRTIKDFVNKPEVVELPGLARRREVDLFVVDALSTLVQTEIDKARFDTSSLATAAGQFSEIRAIVAEAETLARAGRFSEAEKMYEKALGVVPEVAKAYGYFTMRQREAEVARQDSLRAALSRAEAAYEAGRHAESISAYRSAFAYLPESTARVDRTIGNLTSTGYVQGTQAEQTAQSEQADAVLARAVSSFAQSSYEEALASYLDVLSRFPLSLQAKAAVDGIQQSVSAMASRATVALSSREEELAGQVSSLRQNLVAAQASIADQERQIEEYRSTTSTRDAQVASLQDAAARAIGEISQIKKDIAGMAEAEGDPETMDSAKLLLLLRARFEQMKGASQARTVAIDGDLESANTQIRELLAERDRLQQENERLAKQAAAGSVPPELEKLRIEANLYASLTEKYQEYVGLEDSALASGRPDALALAKGYLNSFLGSQQITKAFPDLLRRVKSYDGALVSNARAEGRFNAVLETLDVVIALSQKPAVERESFLDSKIADYASDSGMAGLLTRLKELVSQK